MNCPYCGKADPGTVFTCPECGRKGCAECMKVEGEEYVEGTACNQCRERSERAARSDLLPTFSVEPTQP